MGWLSKLTTAICTVCLAFGISIAFYTPATAQSVVEEDEIIIQGNKRRGPGDPAMNAFDAGDYATAEIEFEKNYKCARRAERSLENAAQSARNGTTNNEIGNGAPEIGGGGSSSAGSSTSASSSAVAENQDRKLKKRCEDKGFQLYMVGLSQLQLNKFAEAKVSFYRAVKFNKTLYDAHFRIGLLELRYGDIPKAEKQLTILQKKLKRCKKCEERPELEEAVMILSDALTKSS